MTGSDMTDITLESVKPSEATGEGHDESDLQKFGYTQRLNRTIGFVTSLCMSISMASVTTGIFTLFGNPFTQTGGVGIWLWIPALAAGLLIAVVYGDLSARIPITGYAYQWSSRLVNSHVGWFTGWFALCAFFAGTASIGVAFATVFTSQVFAHPTVGDVQIVGAVVILAAVLISACGIRRAGHINNIGAVMEILGTVVLAIVVGIGLFFFKDQAGPSILFSTKHVGHGDITVTVVALAALLPVTTFLGWEGSADLAEETVDPRRVAPRAMITSVAVTGVVGFGAFAIFAMAIPHGPVQLLGQSDNPLFYLVQVQLGSLVSLVVKIVVCIAIFACLLANLTIAARMCYSLSRDRMLPDRRVLAKVTRTTKVPLNSLFLVGVVSLGLNFMSAGIATRIYAIVAVMYYGTYLLTMIVVQIAHRRRSLIAAPPGYFGLGRWLLPLSWVGIGWCLLVIGYMTVPAVNNLAAEYSLGAIAVGILWWAVHLRGRINAGTAGPPLEAATAGEAA